MTKVTEMTVHVTILGLDRTGISAALALNGKDKQIRIKGWDSDSERLVQAESSKAFQSLSKDLKTALKDTGLLFITLPPLAFKEVLPEIKKNLNPGALLVYLSTAHILPAQWAQESLGENCRFICMLPAYNPERMQAGDDDREKASEDLFRNGSIYISVPPKAAAEVLDQAADLCVLLGGMPVFAEAAEVEGLAAFSLLLPQLSTAALMAAVSRQPGWKDGRKLAGCALAQVGAPLADLPCGETARIALINRENVLRTLDDLARVLQQVKNTLLEDDPAALQHILEDAADARRQWLNGRMIQPEAREKNGISLEKQALARFLKTGK
jgi:prephenate dehydrogenase